MILSHLFDYAKHREKGQNDNHGSHKRVVRNVRHVVRQAGLFQTQAHLTGEDFVKADHFAFCSGLVLLPSFYDEIKAFFLDFVIVLAVLNYQVDSRAFLLHNVKVVLELDAD
jgi:hypothetical protein